jgi:predicted aspartyl protease
MYFRATNESTIVYANVAGITEPIPTLIDSGASKNFLDISWAQSNNIPLMELSTPRRVIGIQGKELSHQIRFKARLEIEVEGRTFKQVFFAMPTGETKLILGLEWLEESNPVIDWKTKHISWRTEPIQARTASIDDLPEEFKEFADVFSEEKFKRIPDHRPYDCAIDFKDGAELPKPARPIPLSPAESIALREYLDEEIAAGKIRPSKSPIASPCFFVKKPINPKNPGAVRQLRLVQDLRGVNAITKDDRFPMPLMEDLLDKIKDAKIFSKIDLRMGFNNIRIKEGDEWKTAFRTKEGLFEYVVMPFGLKNAPAIFQRYMNHIFHDLIDVCVIVYIDDILVFSKNRSQHNVDVRKVLKILLEENLFAKLPKCEFFVTKLTYTGLGISDSGISMEEEKVKAIKEWKEPRMVKQVQAFLGFANFY